MERNIFLDLYRQRLQINEGLLEPTKATLDTLAERNLRLVPFSNLEMHTVDPESAEIRLDEASLIHKILIKHRGGCCLELNGIFALLLTEIGYEVRKIPCWVYAGKERGHKSGKGKFRTTQTHFFLLVNQKFMVDVGLGEPPLPLDYQLDVEQTTVDGLRHRIRRDPRVWKDRTGCLRHCHILEWLKPGGWVPRLQWDVHSLTTNEPRSLESFQNVIPIICDPSSTFSRKLIICAADRTSKRTLSGRSFKVTSPRTSMEAAIFKEDLSDADLHKILETEFGMSLKEQGVVLDMTKSDLAAASPVWTHL